MCNEKTDAWLRLRVRRLTNMPLRQNPIAAPSSAAVRGDIEKDSYVLGCSNFGAPLVRT